MKKQVSDCIWKYICMGCAFFTVLAVCSITIYMFIVGAPALKDVGVFELLFSSTWAPTAATPKYGISYIILTSIVGTLCAVLLAIPLGIFTAVYVCEISNPKISKFVYPCIEILASIPSVVYGLIGAVVLNPIIYKVEKALFINDANHQFTGGSNLLSAIIVLVIMILPTLISVTVTSLQAVSDDERKASLALGATKMQTIFKVVIPSAKSGIMSGIVLGIGRAIGEAMAINMVAGGGVNLPLPFNSVRFLTTQIASEMAYAEGLHRRVLFTVGLILYIFIMGINLFLHSIKRRSVHE